MWHINTQTTHKTTVSSVAILAYRFRKLILGGAGATDTFHNNVGPKISGVSATSFISPDLLLLTYSYTKQRQNIAGPLHSRRHNVRKHATFRRIRVTFIAVESSKYYIFRVCVYSLSYPACEASYYITIYGLSGCTYNIFQHYFIKGAIF